MLPTTLLLKEPPDKPPPPVLESQSHGQNTGPDIANKAGAIAMEKPEKTMEELHKREVILKATAMASTQGRTSSRQGKIFSRQEKSHSHDNGKQRKIMIHLPIT
jgi:hypothetical protein